MACVFGMVALEKAARVGRGGRLAAVARVWKVLAWGVDGRWTFFVDVVSGAGWVSWACEGAIDVLCNVTAVCSSRSGGRGEERLR